MFCMLEKVEWRDSEGEKKTPREGKNWGAKLFEKQLQNCKCFQWKERKGRKFVLGFFLVYNRTRPIKTIGGQT